MNRNWIEVLLPSGEIEAVSVEAIQTRRSVVFRERPAVLLGLFGGRFILAIGETMVQFVERFRAALGGLPVVENTVPKSVIDAAAAFVDPQLAPVAQVEKIAKQNDSATILSDAEKAPAERLRAADARSVRARK